METCPKCRKQSETVEGRHDRYGIYAGKMCDPCYKDSGLETWVFDPSFAGECLEPEDY